MDWYLILIFMVGLIVVVVVTGLPVAVALLLVSFSFLLLALGLDRTMTLASAQVFDFWSSWTLLAIPMFVLMGEFLFFGGSAADIFDMASKWLSRLPGGLGLVSVGACALFASMVGSSSAATASLGIIAVPEMLKRGYSKRFATGCVAAAGTLAHVIPPSILMVVYASIAEISTGQALMAAVIPGFVCAGYFAIICVIWALAKPKAAPHEPGIAWKQRFLALRLAWQPLVVIVAVMGTLYLGIATATEAAALGAIAAILIALARRRLTGKGFKEALVITGRTSCFIMLIAAAGKTLALSMTYYMIPQHIVEVFMQAELNRWAVMILIQVMYLFLGCFLDPIGMLVVTLPAVLPVLHALGFNLYWFGVMLMINFEIALVTPPFGPQLYIIKGLVPEVSLKDILYGASVFLIAPVMMIVSLMFFPQLALWLPNMMSG